MKDPIDELIDHIKSMPGADHEALEKVRRYCNQEVSFVVKHMCKNCNKVLTDNQKMYSDGVCPHCGALSDGTIVDSIKVSVEVPVKKRVWWKLW